MIQENSWIIRAPAAIIIPRRISAPRIPQKRTRCW
jgi:hypothetical protein